LNTTDDEPFIEEDMPLPFIEEDMPMPFIEEDMPLPQGGDE